jgi:hypothetical protein
LFGCRLSKDFAAGVSRVSFVAKKPCVTVKIRSLFVLLLMSENARSGDGETPVAAFLFNLTGV